MDARTTSPVGGVEKTSGMWGADIGVSKARQMNGIGIGMDGARGRQAGRASKASMPATQLQAGRREGREWDRTPEK
jgi:hypothetical protein